MQDQSMPAVHIARWKMILGGTLLGAFLFVAVGEIIFRIIEPASPPGTTYGKAIHKNSLGLRDREFAIPKPDSVYRILVLGDSFAWGVGLENEHTIPKLLETRLNTERPAKRFEVINAAVPGHNTVEELALLEDIGLRYEPDMVIVLYNLNDIEFKATMALEGYDQTKVVPVVEIDPGEDITSFSKNKGLRGFILSIERISAFTRFLVPRVGRVMRQLGLIHSVEFSWVEKLFQGYVDENPGWAESKRALKGIKRVVEQTKGTMLVALYPLMVDTHDYQGRHVHQTIASYCDSERIPFVDLLPLFEGHDARTFWVNFMDSHPNEEVHRLVAERLLPDVKKLYRPIHRHD